MPENWACTCGNACAIGDRSQCDPLECRAWEGTQTGRMSCAGPNLSTVAEVKDDFGFTLAERHAHIMYAVEALYSAWTWLEDAKTLGEQASGYEKVSNAVSDLVSWHPRWDYERGEIREEEDASEA